MIIIRSTELNWNCGFFDGQLSEDFVRKKVKIDPWKVVSPLSRYRYIALELSSRVHGSERAQPSRSNRQTQSQHFSTRCEYALLFFSLLCLFTTYICDPLARGLYVNSFIRAAGLEISLGIDSTFSFSSFLNSTIYFEGTLNKQYLPFVCRFQGVECFMHRRSTFNKW